MLATVPSASSAFALSPWLLTGFGKNLPQSTNGVNVMTVPAAAISFRKSRRDTRPPIAGGVCAIPKKKESLIINKPLEMRFVDRKKDSMASRPRERSQERIRSEEHTSELQSRQYLVCRL